MLHVGGTSVDHEIGFCHMRQCPAGVMGHSTHTMSSVGKVITDTMIAPHVATESLTLLNATDIVVDTVNSLKKNPQFRLELTYSI